MINSDGDTFKSRPVLLKQSSSIMVDDPQLTKHRDLERKKMLEPKIQKNTYVKKKKLDLDFKNEEYETKNMDIRYDMVNILKRLNDHHSFDSLSSGWVIAELQKRKPQLPAKAAQILSISGIKPETALRLLNLKNTVGYHII